jgi:hypothetical protein
MCLPPRALDRLIYHGSRSADRLMTAGRARGSVEFDLAWRRAGRRMREQGFTRDAVDEIAKALGRRPLTDEEWADTNEPR